MPNGASAAPAARATVFRVLSGNNTRIDTMRKAKVPASRHDDPRRISSRANEHEHDGAEKGDAGEADAMLNRVHMMRADVGGAETPATSSRCN